MHEICNEEDYGSIDFKHFDQRITKIKIYHSLCYEILSVIQKQMLDKMPGTMRTMRMKVRQLQDLLDT